MQDVVQGALSLPRAPLALAALVAAAIVCGLSLRSAVLGVVAAVGAVLAALPAPLPWAGLAAAGAVALLGFAIVLQLRVSRLAAYGAAVAAGAACGWAAEFPWATALELAGGALATFAVAALAAYGIHQARRLSHAQLALRVVGAWVTALALLMLLLGLRG